MFAIEETKLPPPQPATASMVVNGVSGLPKHHATPRVGINRRRAEKMVQLRPPNVATMKVQGIRSVATTREGMEMSHKSSRS